MKFLFENIAFEYSTLAALYESPSYPVVNLLHDFIEKRFQSTALSDTITFDFDYDTHQADCFFYAFNTATSGSVSFYNGGALQSTIALESPAADSGAVYFPVLTFDEVRITISRGDASVPLFLGAVGFGVAYTVPDPAATWTEDQVDNSNYSSSPRGQTSQEYIEPFKALQLTVPGLERETAIEIQDLFKTVGVGGRVWFDQTNLNHAFRAPFPAILVEPVKPVKNGRRYDLVIKLREAR